MVAKYEEAIKTVRYKKGLKVSGVLFVLCTFVSLLPISGFLIVDYLTEKITMLTAISVIYLLIWAVMLTLLRDKVRRNAFEQICTEIENGADQPYQFNKYLMDNINFQKVSLIGHLKTITKYITVFQIIPFILKYCEKIPKLAGFLIWVGLIATVAHFTLHFIDERLEALKTALQFSLERKWKNMELGGDGGPEGSKGSSTI